MKKIKNNYTNFILTVIAVAMIGILFKGEIIKPSHANVGYQAICVHGYTFVANENSIVQLLRYSHKKERAGLVVEC